MPSSWDAVRAHTEGMKANKDAAEDQALWFALRELSARSRGTSTIFSLYTYGDDEFADHNMPFLRDRRRR